MSDPDQALDLIYLVALLVLVVSGLVVRRLPLGQSLKMAGAWLLIFAAGFVILALKDDIVAAAKRAAGQDRPAGTVAQGEPVRIRKSADGHFWAEARLNGEEVKFLIDSGATVTSISRRTADRAGIDYSGGFPTLVQTANGMVTAQRGRAAVTIGSISRGDVAVHVSEAFGDTNVLGMNFLSTLRSWGVEGPYLLLRG